MSDKLSMDRYNKISSAVSLFIQLKEFNKALILLTKELQHNPDDRALLYNIGLTYRAMNDFAKAEACYQKALSSKKGYAPDELVLCSLGIVYQLMENYDKAIQLFSKAIEKDEHYVNAYNSLGLTYRKKGDLDKAIEAYDDGIKSLFIAIYKSLNNSIDNKRMGFIGYNPEGRWIKIALNIMLYFAAKDDMDCLSWPTSEQAEQYYRSHEHGGLLFTDLFDTTGKKARSMLPNYLDTFYIKLHDDEMYSFLLSNKARVVADQGKIEEAKVLLKEAIEFIPKDVDFKDPYLALQELGGS